MNFLTDTRLVPKLAVSYSELYLVIFALVIALVSVLAFTPLAMRLAVAAGVMDQPHARRVHTKPTPRWGGLAMFAAFALTMLIILPIRQHLFPAEPLSSNPALAFVERTLGLNLRVLGILLGGLLVTALGAIDDKYSVPAKVKLLGQILSAAVLPLCGVRMVVMFDSDIPVWLGALLTILWVVAITTTRHRLDGLDGLAAGVSGIAAVTFVLIGIAMRGKFGEAMLAAGMAGACLGFLRYNFNPARVFMGDAGSHFLGYTIGALTILANWKLATGFALAVPVLMLAVPIFDTAFAIVRRLLRRQPIFSPDKGHLHHRLLNMGLDQRSVVLTIYLLTTVGCILALIIARVR